MRVLLVDDEVFARRTLTRLLKTYDESMEIYEAEDGYDGYILYKETKPDVVITDILMEGVTNGQWLIEKLLVNYPGANIIVASGLPSTKLLVFKLMGAYECLQKPIKYDKLCQILNEIKEKINLKCT